MNRQPVSQFLLTDGVDMRDVAFGSEGALLTTLFGVTPDGAVTEAADRATARCQAAAMKPGPTALKKLGLPSLPAAAWR
jgi:hypothetical protein